MEIEYAATTTRDDDEWRLHGVVHVYGQAGDWTIFAAVVPARQFAIVELRILPAEWVDTRSDPEYGFRELRAPTEDNARGAWSGRPANAPRGGIPTRTLRAIRETDIRNAAREWVVEHALTGGADDPVWHRVAEAVLRDDLTSRRLTPDQRLAGVAANYVALIEAGEHRPNAVLAERYDRTPSWVAQEVYRARQRGLLEPRKVNRGRAAGHLTDKAKQILHDLEQEYDR